MDHLLHLACTSDGNVLVDRWGRLPGRGAHVCFKASCIRKAVKPATLVAAFKRPLTAPDAPLILKSAVGLLSERLVTCLSMAQKAGFAISGYMPLRQALAEAKLVCLVLATDIVDTRKQEYQTWCARHHVPSFVCFTKARLGTIIGKSSRSAVGLTDVRFYRLLSITKASLDTLQSCDPSIQTKC